MEEKNNPQLTNALFFLFVFEAALAPLLIFNTPDLNFGSKQHSALSYPAEFFLKSRSSKLVKYPEKVTKKLIIILINKKEINFKTYPVHIPH